MAKKTEATTVESKLRALYDLQLIDSRIDEIINLRGELPLEVEDLENEISVLNNSSNKIKTEILKTSLSYGLVSSLTSLVAVDTSPSKPDGIKLSQERIASALPYGWDEHVFDLEKNYDPILNFYRKQTKQASIHQASLKMQSSEIALPDTSLNWKMNLLLGLAITILGLFFINCSRGRNNA